MLITKPNDVRKWITKYRAEYSAQKNLAQLSPGRQGRITGALNTALKHDKDSPDENRRLVLAWLFLPDDCVLLPVSSKTLTVADWLSLERWIFGGNDNRLFVNFGFN